MALLQALPRDLAGFFRRSGGVSDWFWKGEQAGQSAGVGTVEASVVYEDQPMLLRYTLTVADRGNQLHVIKEGLHNPNTDFSYQGSLVDGQSGSSFLMPGTDPRTRPRKSPSCETGLILSAFTGVGTWATAARSGACPRLTLHPTS